MLTTRFIFLPIQQTPFGRRRPWPALRRHPPRALRPPAVPRPRAACARPVGPGGAAVAHELRLVRVRGRRAPPEGGPAGEEATRGRVGRRDGGDRGKEEGGGAQGRRVGDVILKQALAPLREGCRWEIAPIATREGG